MVTGDLRVGWIPNLLQRNWSLSTNCTPIFILDKSLARDTGYPSLKTFQNNPLRSVRFVRARYGYQGAVASE